VTLLDISIVRAKEREKSARYYCSDDTIAPGEAGVDGTKRAPVMLSEKQHHIIGKFAVLVRPVDWERETPHQRREAYRRDVLRRLSGVVGDGAVHSACLSAALDENYLTTETLRAAGISAMHNNGQRTPGRSKAILEPERPHRRKSEIEK
jgi:hypothetical protein